MKTIIRLSIMLTIIFIAWGCGPGSVVVSARPETPVYTRPVAPGSDYIWIDGEWYWSGGRYVYRNGYWSRPRGGRVWSSGHWEQHGNGWHWQKGRWHR